MQRRRWTFYSPGEQQELSTESSGQMEQFFEEVLYTHGYPALALAIDTTMELGGPIVRECLDDPPGGEDWGEVYSWISTQVEQLRELEFTLEASPWRTYEIVDWLDTARLMDPWPSGEPHICNGILDAIQFAYVTLQKWDRGKPRREIAYNIRVMVVSMAEAAAFEEIQEMPPRYRPVPDALGAEDFLQNWFNLYISRLAMRPMPEEDR